jgi:hypothetical protein
MWRTRLSKCDFRDDIELKFNCTSLYRCICQIRSHKYIMYTNAHNNISWINSCILELLVYNSVVCNRQTYSWRYCDSDALEWVSVSHSSRWYIFSRLAQHTTRDPFEVSCINPGYNETADYCSSFKRAVGLHEGKYELTTNFVAVAKLYVCTSVVYLIVLFYIKLSYLFAKFPKKIRN